MLDVSADHCRKLYHRARTHLARFRTSGRAAADLTRRLLSAASGGDLAGLEALLCEDAVVLSDGGGRVPAARRPVVGRTTVARFLLAVSQGVSLTVTTALVEVNGMPALIATDAGRPIHVGLIESEDGIQARRIYIVSNSDKLGYVAAQLAAAVGAAATDPRPA